MDGQGADQLMLPLSTADLEQIEALTGITPDQVRRLGQTEFMITHHPVVAIARLASVDLCRCSGARMLSYGCPSEAH